MRLEDQISIAKRLLGFLQGGSAELAPSQHRMRVTDYTDAEIWADEVQACFKRLPIVAGMSCELPGPGSYMALDIVGSPILLVRDEQGKLNALLNVCRHRGAALVAEGCGKAKHFTCPYHAWTYDQSGRLVGVANEDTFGPVLRDDHGLTALPCAERAGLIFIGLTPGMPFDIDQFLAGADHHMSASEPEVLHYCGSRLVDAPNWKLVLEGHLESYHFASLHRNSIAPSTFSNCAAIDRFGPHILITFAPKKIVDLLELPESDWRPLRDGLIGSQYVLFPGVTITLQGDSVLTQIIHPGNEVGKSTNRIILAYHEPADTPEMLAERTEFLDQVGALVEREDYSVGQTIQKGMKSGAQSEVIFGRNEPGPIYFHEAIASALEREALHQVNVTCGTESC